MLILYKQNGGVRLVRTPSGDQGKLSPPVAAYGVPYSQLSPAQKALLTAEERAIMRDAEASLSAL